MEEVLEAMDDNNSGRVSKDEYLDFMVELGYPDRSEAMDAFGFIDSDQSGIIGIQELDFLGSKFNGGEFFVAVLFWLFKHC